MAFVPVRFIDDIEARRPESLGQLLGDPIAHCHGGQRMLRRSGDRLAARNMRRSTALAAARRGGQCPLRRENAQSRLSRT
jgi:hypothetical protein